MKSKNTKMPGIVIPAIIMVLSVVFFLSVLSARAKGDEPRIFGYSFHIVVSDSMTGLIEIDDFVIAKQYDFTAIVEGDIIVYESPVEANKRIIHKVISVNTDGTVSTKGVKPGAAEDPYAVQSKHFIGLYVYHSTFIGKIILFFSDLKNIAFFAVIVFSLVLIVRQLKAIFGKK